MTMAMTTSVCRFLRLNLHSGPYRNPLGLAWSHVSRPCVNVHQLVDKTLNNKVEPQVISPNQLGMDLDSVLQAMSKNNLNVKTAAELLGSLASVFVSSSISLKEVEDNTGFQDVCTMLGKDCQSLGHSALIFSFRNLLTLGVPVKNYTVQSMKTELIWKLRRMNIKNLVYILSVCNEFENPDLQRKVVAEIQRRWVEVTDLGETCLLLSHHNKFTPEFISKLEDRSMEIVEMTKADDIARLFVVLANLKQRSTPLLRCMAFHLSKHSEKLDAKKMTNVLCAMNSLSFPDHLLLQRISSDLVPEVVNLEKSSTVAAILTSLGQLRWKNEGLLNEFTQWIQKNFDACRIQDLVAYILTVAGLNYTSLSAPELIRKLLSRVTQENVQRPCVWLDVVWSLVVLGVASPQHLESVLKPDFYQNTLGIPRKLKLRSINASAEFEMSNYKGPTIAAEYFEDISMPRSKEVQKVSLAVIDALSNFLPRGKFLMPNSMTRIGIPIDAEFNVGVNAKPLPISEPNKKLLGKVHRMALLVWDYKDFTLNSPSLTGMNALTVRLLQKLGYLVVQVPHTEFIGIKTTLDRVQYLQTKIAETVASVSAEK